MRHSLMQAAKLMKIFYASNRNTGTPNNVNSLVSVIDFININGYMHCLTLLICTCQQSFGILNVSVRSIKKKSQQIDAKKSSR